MPAQRLPFDPTHFSKLSKEGKSYFVADTFKSIYESNHWKNNESASGNGSDMTQTTEIRKHLPGLLREFDIQTFLDLPCGDFNWMQTVALPVREYIGCDIVEEVIRQNQKKFGNAHRDYRVLNLVSDDLPKADLIFCRDCLVHLSFQDIKKALANIKRRGISYLLTTTFTNTQENQDIVTGDWRTLNLEKSPFSLPAPLRLINEKCTEGNGYFADKSLGLWKMND